MVETETDQKKIQLTKYKYIFKKYGDSVYTDSAR